MIGQRYERLESPLGQPGSKEIVSIPAIRCYHRKTPQWLQIRAPSSIGQPANAGWLGFPIKRNPRTKLLQRHPPLLAMLFKAWWPPSGLPRAASHVFQVLFSATCRAATLAPIFGELSGRVALMSAVSLEMPQVVPSQPHDLGVTTTTAVPWCCCIMPMHVSFQVGSGPTMCVAQFALKSAVVKMNSFDG